MNNITELSIAIPGDRTIEEYIRLSTLIDQYGFHTLSIYDDLLFKPAWPLLSVVASNTEKVRIGPAVVNPYLVHPAITAGNLAVLDEISKGRAYLGIGKGAFLDFLNLESQKPLTAMREATEIIQSLIRGDRKPYTGEMCSLGESAFLRYKPVRDRIPIIYGTWGFQTSELAGQIADGIKVSPLWNSDYADELRNHLSKGALSTGRDKNSLKLCLGVLTSVDEDEITAKEFAKQSLAVYLPYLSPMTEYLEISKGELNKVSPLSKAGRYADAAIHITDRTLDSFALYGTPAQVSKKIQHLLNRVSVDRIEFGSPLGPDPVNAITLLGEQVLPVFR